MAKLCPDCDSEMVLLLYSWVCEACDLRKRERERRIEKPYSRDDEHRRFLDWLYDLEED